MKFFITFRWRWGGTVCSHHRPHGKHWIFIFFIEFVYLGYLLPFHWIFNSIWYVSHRFPDFFDILQVNKVSTRFFVQVSYPKSISKEAKDICKGVGINVVDVIIGVSINIVITVIPDDKKNSIRGKSPVKDTKLQIDKKWTKEMNSNCSVPGEKPVKEVGLLGKGRRRDQESCIL